MSSLADLVPSGVITGDDVLTLFDHARTNGYAIPAVNCTRYVHVTFENFGEWPHIPPRILTHSCARLLCCTVLPRPMLSWKPPARRSLR